MSNSSKTLSISDTSSKKSKPSAWIARLNSFLSMVPEPSSSHWRKRSITRADDLCSASRNEKRRYSDISTLPEPSRSSSLKRSCSSSSVKLPSSRDRTIAQNSPKSSLLS